MSLAAGVRPPSLRPRQYLAQLSPDAFSNIAWIVKIHDLVITIQSPRVLYSLRPRPRHHADQHRCLLERHEGARGKNNILVTYPVPDLLIYLEIW